MQLRLFLTRGLVAIAWAVVFAMASDSLTTGVGLLLVLYPLIDAVASVLDARGQQGSARLRMVAVYAAGGGLEFVIQAWLLARRVDRAAPVGS